MANNSLEILEPQEDFGVFFKRKLINKMENIEFSSKAVPVRFFNSQAVVMDDS